MKKNRYKKLFVFLLLEISLYAQSQTRADVDRLYEQQLQHCADATGHTDQCNRRLYDGLDSLLNVAYKNLLSKLSPSKRSALQKEERNWIKKRDLQFQQFEKEVNTHDGTSVPGTEIYDTFLYEKKNELVRKRVLQLIERL
ncbi:hypothetical protein A8C56_14185 [Niabella ginsenosidivorans]|uniref:Lysozyme inhibitor LprI-like N-terminal domain-containing protein n=1 Tax=Niabella ginsenosidivorans TaxID=1176587 RepID=A0A1A9I5Z4_9BACT|nr:lysozyme inhibitor LprI family protein [Niabella ginsenosidivorans]ANH81964.1 hypothetical protein A8C56_14185 [Niabella ginsenosidivorans]